MPRTAPLYSEFFHEPLTEDVEELLARFQHSDTVRYEGFSALWRQMRFSDAFTGVTSAGEMKKFCRVALATAVSYFLPPYSYQIRVGGLYLMFAFYHAQPAVPPVNIRLALRDWPLVQKFLRDTVDAGHYDVLYVYRRLVSAKAVHYTAMPHFLTFQKQRRPKRATVCAEFLGRATAVQELLSADVLEEVANVHGQYEQLMEATPEVSGKVTAVAHRDLASRLQGCASGFLAWQQKTFSPNGDKDSEDDDDDEKEVKPGEGESSSSARARLLSSIKHKSYSGVQEAPKSRRHRQVEAADSSSSGAEQVQEKKIRPPSLRARTQESLGVVQEESKAQAWLLSAPEKHHRVPVRRTNQRPPLKP
ncbi:hypothetical protein F2P81_008396 [Scophthalmus maximus]|uniref:snRNA-activating protein complex subunit 1 n=1 Tax=Scophthalmus maximus TaxID=52904 RepID=A0A6A4TB65_SCOMX|nr:hypothetical protein F2P81_008396 [Scophthalmus maximus]